MSGGPAFDKNGKLIGILTSSFEAGDDLGPSYVSLLWPDTIPSIGVALSDGAHSDSNVPLVH